MTEEVSGKEQSVEMELGEAAVIKLPRRTSLVRADGLLVRLRPFYEGVIHFTLFICASISVLVTVGIVVILLYESVQFFFDVSIIEFLTGTRWTPLLKPQHFGILPLMCGTMLVAGGSAIVAVPIGLGTAIYLSEYASPRFRDIVKPFLEILAGIPSVVYGYLAIVTVSPIIRYLFPSAGVFNAASACIVVGIMILPMIISLSEDILQSVPTFSARSRFCVRRQQIRSDGASSRAGSFIGNYCQFSIGDFQSHRRDDGSHSGSRCHTQANFESSGKHSNHDSLHCAGQSG